MALSKTTTTSTGIDVTNAYIRVDTVAGYKGRIDTSVNYYVSKQEFIDGKGYVQQQMFAFVPDIADGSANFIAQAYEHLKTLPEFADAIDC